MLTNFADITLTGIPAFVVIVILLYGPIILVTILVSRALRRIQLAKQIRRKVIVAEYQPPLGLSPAELGYLYDTKVRNQELVATLLDLQQREVISIRQKNDYPFATPNKNSDTKLKPHEQYLVNALGKGSTLHRVFFLRHRTFFEATLYEQLVTAGYLESSLFSGAKNWILWLNLLGVFIFPGSLCIAALFKPDLGILGLLSTFFGGVFIMLVFGLLGAPIYTIFSGITLAIYTRIAGKSWLRTRKLKDEWRAIEGYRQYVHMVELDNLQFESSTLKGMSKNSTLPYAIALGFSVSWKGQFDKPESTVQEPVE